MRLPRSLQKHDGGDLPDGDDKALVKMGTLKTALAFLLRQIPVPGGGLSVRRSRDGDVWTGSVSAATGPWTINAAGRISPGVVNGVMPTLGGEPLDTTDNVIDLTDHSGTFKVWLKLNFTPTYVETFLADFTLDSAQVETGTALPADDADTKHLQIGSVLDGAPEAAYFGGSLSVVLRDAGANATSLLYTSA